MAHDHGAAPDARTPPVAAWAILAAMKGEELQRWRMARITDNPPAAERGCDKLPFPFGWYVACYSDEVPAGVAKPLRYFGRELVIWRGADGQARILDAYCRHLGAHMGHGGKVNGNLLECPFHAWRYDETGAVREIPYSQSIPPQAKRPCGQWPVAEVNGFVWVWYHPQGVAPMWQVEPLAEASDPDWTPYDRNDWLVHAPMQFMAENTADSAHFQFVHGTATFPDAGLTFEGHRRSGIVEARMGTPRGEVDGVIANYSVGPGQAWTRFTGISETLLVAGMTPVNKDLVRVRFAFTQPKAQADGQMGGLARAMIKDILKQFDQDKVIWDRQRFVEQALICQGDGPIADFRRWYYQFYAEWPQGPGGRRTPPAAMPAQQAA